MSEFIRRLDELRQREHLSHNGLAEAIAVSPSTWSRVRRGLYPPSARLISGALRRWPELAIFLAIDVQRGNATFAGGQRAGASQTGGTGEAA